MDPELFEKVDVWAAHHRLKTMNVRSATVAAGGGREPAEADPDAFKSVPTLADLICGRVPGRATDSQITYFGGAQARGSEESFGSSGTGVQFSFLGYEVYSIAKERELGHESPTDWFLEDLHP